MPWAITAMLAGSHRQQRELLHLLRFLDNELRIPLVTFGTREAHIALRSGDRIENRFEPLALPLWEDGPNLARLPSGFEAVLPLSERCGLGNDLDLRRHILDASGGMIGKVLAMLAAAYCGPDERRGAFGGALRAGT